MSNLRKIQEIQRLTKDIEFNQKYLYGNNDGQTSAFFLDPDQLDWGNRNEIFEQYVEDLEKKIERRDRLNDLRFPNGLQRDSKGTPKGLALRRCGVAGRKSS
jgi:hypothetical protein